MAIPTIPSEAQQAQQVAKKVLGESIVGIYLFGSAVVGGLKPDSDVDILVTVAQPLCREQRKALAAQLMSVSGAIGNIHGIRPLELTVITVSGDAPWPFPPQAEFVYGEWMREQFEAGSVPAPARDPDLVIVLKKVREHGLALHGPNAAEVIPSIPIDDIRVAIQHALPTLLAESQGDERNVILTLARMWLTASTGTIEPKDVAAEWAEKRAPSRYAAQLKYAREGYLGIVDDQWLDRQEEFDALVRYMERAITLSLS